MIDISGAEFYAVVLNSPVPVAVDFYSPTCGPCRVLKPIMEAMAEAIGDRARIVAVNVADNEQLVERYGITSLPTLLVFNGGREVHRMIGLSELAELRAALGVQAMDRRELADAVLEALHDGIVPWRFPFSDLPDLKPVFGTFNSGEPRSEAEADYDQLNAVLRATGVETVHHWKVKRPRFDRHRDKILLPPRSRFLTARTYHATRIHEALHAVEQAHRVGWAGSDHQSELVCEVGTSLLESHLRLPPDQDITNIRKWLPAWARGIMANPDYLFDAVAQAEKAVRYLLGLRRVKEAA